MVGHRAQQCCHVGLWWLVMGMKASWAAILYGRYRYGHRSWRQLVKARRHLWWCWCAALWTLRGRSLARLYKDRALGAKRRVWGNYWLVYSRSRLVHQGIDLHFCRRGMGAEPWKGVCSMWSRSELSPVQWGWFFIGEVVVMFGQEGPGHLRADGEPVGCVSYHCRLSASSVVRDSLLSTELAGKLLLGQLETG